MFSVLNRYKRLVASWDSLLCFEIILGISLQLDVRCYTMLILTFFSRQFIQKTVFDKKVSDTFKFHNLPVSTPQE